jgi:hypothetical protein
MSSAARRVLRLKEGRLVEETPQQAAAKHEVSS